jgi:hypothetical protein
MPNPVNPNPEFSSETRTRPTLIENEELQMKVYVSKSIHQLNIQTKQICNQNQLSHAIQQKKAMQEKEKHRSLLTEQLFFGVAKKKWVMKRLVLNRNSHFSTPFMWEIII